ncbi:MAG: helix-turn-helix transcriptional regulator [Bacteroidota bacterium]|nr:helix-turn-helix transcriptional regulator [Bacteroidota bacterium]
MGIGEKIKQFRLSLGLSQLELSNVLEINQSKVSKMETESKKEIDKDVLIALVKNYNINLNTLFDDKYSNIEYCNIQIKKNYSDNSNVSIVSDQVLTTHETEINELKQKIKILERERENLYDQLSDYKKRYQKK